ESAGPSRLLGSGRFRFGPDRLDDQLPGRRRASAPASTRAVGARLWNSIRMVEKEDGDFLVWTLSDIDSAGNAVRLLIPPHLYRLDRETLIISAVLVFDGENIPAQDNRHAVERVAVPMHRLAG